MTSPGLRPLLLGLRDWEVSDPRLRVPDTACSGLLEFERLDALLNNIHHLNSVGLAALVPLAPHRVFLADIELSISQA